MAKGRVDPDTGYLLTDGGQPDPQEMSEIRWTKSIGYIENFLEHTEFETVRVTNQHEDVKQTVGSDALLKLMQWWLIRNKR